MPEIPDGKNRPSIEETIIDLLESIALEEVAISHILNSEGEKLQAIIEKYKCDKINISEMYDASRSVNKTLVDLIMKEWLLLLKFNYIDEFSYKNSINLSNNTKNYKSDCKSCKYFCYDKRNCICDNYIKTQEDL